MSKKKRLLKASSLNPSPANPLSAKIPYVDLEDSAEPVSRAIKGDNEGEIYLRNNNPFKPTQWALVASNSWKSQATTVQILMAGEYSIVIDGRDDRPIFIKKDGKSDNLISVKGGISELVFKEIDNFWTRGGAFKKGGFLHRRGYFFYGPQGCHAKGAGILMYDGSIKPVENITVGDVLMGPDGGPRKVLELVQGEDELFEITPTKGDSFIVNRGHVLYLAPSGRNETFKFPLHISVNDYLSMTKPSKERFLLTRSSAIEFKEKDFIIPPYILGLWLGDGTSSKPEITNIDKGVIEEWAIFCQEKGLFVKKHGINYRASNLMRGKKNHVLNDIKALGVYKNKHVPFDYLTGSIKQRLELIAGLIDTDGSSHYGGIDFINKNESIVDSLVYLCRSVGLAAYKKPSIKGVWVQNKKHYREGLYYRVYISGDTDMIPCRIPRKKCFPRKQIKNVLRTGFSIKSVGRGEYFGFILNKDHLYLTSDFTIHHNSGKSSIVRQIIDSIISHGGVVFHCGHPSAFLVGLEAFRQVEPDRPIVCVFEDIDAIIKKYGEEELLSILDGANQINKVMNLATSNYPELLDKRITSRPRRFDRIYKIISPDDKIRKQYLESKLGKKDDMNKWLRLTSGLSFAGLTEAVISVTCLGNNLEKTVEILKNLEKGQPSSSDYQDRGVVGFGNNGDD